MIISTPNSGDFNAEYVALVDRGQIKPCRAIDLGCGAGAKAIYLAQKGSKLRLAQSIPLRLAMTWLE